MGLSRMNMAVFISRLLSSAADLTSTKGYLAVGVLVRGLRVLAPFLAVLLCRRRMRLRLVVLALLMMMGGLQVVVRGGMVRRRLVMALVGGMLARCGHVGPILCSCSRTPAASWPE